MCNLLILLWAIKTNEKKIGKVLCSAMQENIRKKDRVASLLALVWYLWGYIVIYVVNSENP